MMNTKLFVFSQILMVFLFWFELWKYFIAVTVILLYKYSTPCLTDYVKSIYVYISLRTEQIYDNSNSCSSLQIQIKFVKCTWRALKVTSYFKQNHRN